MKVQMHQTDVMSGKGGFFVLPILGISWHIGVVEVYVGWLIWTVCWTIREAKHGTTDEDSIDGEPICI